MSVLQGRHIGTETNCISVISTLAVALPVLNYPLACRKFGDRTRYYETGSRPSGENKNGAFFLSKELASGLEVSRGTPGSLTP